MFIIFNEVDMVKTYLSGDKIPVRALDDCVYQIAKYTKDSGMNEIETKKLILEWIKKNNLYFNDINNNIDNAFKTKSKLKSNFKVFINSEDIDKINFAADFKTGKKVALFLLIYAKIHANQNGEFKIRISTMSEWIGIAKSNLYNRYISSLIRYGFISQVEQKSYSKYLNQKRDEKRSYFKINHPLKNEGEFFIEKNEDFEKLFNEIFC